MAKLSEKGENFMRKFRIRTDSDFSKLTASELLTIWNHYDRDGNGYLEKKELDDFLREFVMSVCDADADEAVSMVMLDETKKDLFDAYDENEDGRIELRELAELLSVDENFLLLFKLENRLTSSTDFMEIWKSYDDDQSGYIESEELKNFLTDLLTKHASDSTVSHEKLEEYSSAILQIFDENNDGKLQLSEMARLLPMKENVLLKTIGAILFNGSDELSYQDIENIFKSYDQDGSGNIEKFELDGFAKDLLSLMKLNYTMEDVESFKALLLKFCDMDGDGKICKSELTILMLGLQNFFR